MPAWLHNLESYIAMSRTSPDDKFSLLLQIWRSVGLEVGLPEMVTQMPGVLLVPREIHSCEWFKCPLYEARAELRARRMRCSGCEASETRYVN